MGMLYPMPKATPRYQPVAQPRAQVAPRPDPDMDPNVDVEDDDNAVLRPARGNRLVIKRFDYETPKPMVYKTSMMVMRRWDYPIVPDLSAYAEFGCPYHKTNVNQFGYVSNRSQQSQLLEYKRMKYGYHSLGFDVSSLTPKAQTMHHLK
jgi:hypothetical protein